MSRSALILPLLLIASWPGAGSAQDVAPRATVIQTENVRYAYARVLRVTPVYQTLTATSVERRCQDESLEDDGDSRLSRMVDKVKDVLGGDGEGSTKPEPLPDGCVAVPVERQFRRPIAYDVDYVYKGAKYRSRLPEDPGNRLRIRIGVTPVVTGMR